MTGNTTSSLRTFKPLLQADTAKCLKNDGNGRKWLFVRLSGVYFILKAALDSLMMSVAAVSERGRDGTQTRAIAA
jgi:hypothetical protein